MWGTGLGGVELQRDVGKVSKDVDGFSRGWGNRSGGRGGTQEGTKKVVNPSWQKGRQFNCKETADGGDLLGREHKGTQTTLAARAGTGARCPV